MISEERIRELADEHWAVFDFHVAQRTVKGLRGHLKCLIRTVAAESRKEGIEEMRDAAINKSAHSSDVGWIVAADDITEEAERLKEQG